MSQRVLSMLLSSKLDLQPTCNLSFDGWVVSILSSCTKSDRVCFTPLFLFMSLQMNMNDRWSWNIKHIIKQMAFKHHLSLTIFYAMMTIETFTSFTNLLIKKITLSSLIGLYQIREVRNMTFCPIKYPQSQGHNLAREPRRRITCSYLGK